MTEDKLRKFDKETLVKFIFREVFGGDTIGILKNIQLRLRFEKAMLQSKELLNEMDKLSKSKKIEDQYKWHLIYKKYTKLAKQTEKYLGLDARD